MRGNEDRHIERSRVPPEAFTIPMRGNELPVKTYVSGSELSSLRSP